MPVKHTSPGGVLNKLDGTSAPGVGDDSADGYSKTSLWIHANISPVEVYVCVDNTAGAAIWVKTTLTIDELGSMALQNSNSIAVTGGTINGTTIGATTPAAVTATTVATGVAAATSRLDISGVAVAAAGSDSNINIDLTPKGTGEVNIPKVDIDGGTIDGATIATSNITVGSGKTLDVSAGTLTLANDQISGDKVEGGTIAAITITALTTTAARVVGVNPITTAAGTTAAAATDHVVVFTGSTTHTYTLPACATGRELRLKNRSTGAITVNRAGSDTIDNAGTSLTLNADDAVILVGNSTNWMVF